MFIVEFLGDSEEGDKDYEELNDSEMQSTEPVISVNALAGNQDFQTMRVVGVVNSKPLHILIDSGSTHNFVDLSLAQKIGCTIESIPDQAITVSDGNQIVMSQVCGVCLDNE